jgi:hypothetical protein
MKGTAAMFDHLAEITVRTDHLNTLQDSRHVIGFTPAPSRVSVRRIVAWLGGHAAPSTRTASSARTAPSTRTASSARTAPAAAAPPPPQVGHG